jgi:hypothetical protein
MQVRAGAGEGKVIAVNLLQGISFWLHTSPSRGQVPDDAKNHPLYQPNLRLN